jgi:predicted MFS family arabinose efflux permease
MMNFIRPRLRKPLLRGIALLGIAAAWVIGSHTWEPAIVIALVAVGQTVAWYTWAGADADESALLASRGDERQKQVGLRARALAGAVALAAAYAGLVITLAVKIADAWPFAAVLAVTGFAYLLGLSSYGSGEPGPEGEVTARHQTRSPASS